jgi:hypothetical protein
MEIGLALGGVIDERRMPKACDRIDKAGKSHDRTSHPNAG